MSEQPRLQVLVVDDEPFNREAATAILSAAGHGVLCAENGQEALDILATGASVDLILMDIIMPVMNGIEAIQRLRADTSTRHIPILCLSAKASGSHQREALTAGADHFLAKPYRRKDLINAGDEVLRARGRLASDKSLA